MTQIAGVFRRVGWRIGLYIGIPLLVMASPVLAFAVTDPFSSGSSGQAYQHAVNQLNWVQQTVVSFLQFLVKAVLSITGLHGVSQLVFNLGTTPTLSDFGAWPSGWWSQVIGPVITAMQAFSLLIATSILAIMAIQYFLQASTNPNARMAWSTALWHFMGAAGLIALFPLLVQWLFYINQGVVSLLGSLAGATPSLLSLPLLPNGAVGFWGWFSIELILVGITLWVNLFFMFRALTLALLVAFGPLLGGLTMLHPNWVSINAAYWRELSLDIFQQAFLAGVLMMFFRVYLLSGSGTSWLLIAAFALTIPALTNMFRGLFGHSALGGRSGMMAVMGAGAVLGAMDLARQTARTIRGGHGQNVSAPSTSSSSGYVNGSSAASDTSAVRDAAQTDRIRTKDSRRTGTGPATGVTERHGSKVAAARGMGGAVGHAAGALALGLVGAGAAGFAGADIGARIGGAAGARVGRGMAGGTAATGILVGQGVGAGGDRIGQWWNTSGRDRLNTLLHKQNASEPDSTSTISPTATMDGSMPWTATGSDATVMDAGSTPTVPVANDGDLKPLTLAHNMQPQAAPSADAATNEDAVPPFGFDARTNPNSRPAPATFKGFLGQRLVGNPQAGMHAPTAGMTVAEGRLGAMRETLGLLGAGVGGAAGQRVGVAAADVVSPKQRRTVENQWRAVPGASFNAIQSGDKVSVVQHNTHREMWHTQNGVSQRIGLDQQHGDARVPQGSPHIQDYTVVDAGSALAQNNPRAIALDAERVLIPNGQQYVQHADTTLSTDFDAMVFNHLPHEEDEDFNSL